MSKIQTARQRGKDLENFVADKLKSSGLDPQAIRQIGSGSGLRKGDIHNSLGWTFECKNVGRFNWEEAAKQVRREAMGYQKEAIIYHPKNRPLDDSVAIININDFMELLKGERREMNDISKIPKYLVNKVREELRQLLKYLGN